MSDEEAEVPQVVDASELESGSQQIERMSIEELTELAKDARRGVYLFHTQIKDPKLVPMVFLPLSLGAAKYFTEEDQRNIVLYQAYSKAGPQSINGHPMFFEVMFMHRDDYNKMVDIVEALQKAEEAAIGVITAKEKADDEAAS